MTRVRVVVAAVVGLVVVGLVVVGFMLERAGGQRGESGSPAVEARVAKAPPPIPTLYCEFYNFMHSATVVSFLFAVETDTTDPRFLEMAVVEPDGTRTGYDGVDRPRWTRASDGGTATIASPDGTTRIVLYGFRPERSGTFWTEAGVRSDTYKNLDGKCRQANFGAS